MLHPEKVSTPSQAARKEDLQAWSVSRLVVPPCESHTGPAEKGEWQGLSQPALGIHSGRGVAQLPVIWERTQAGQPQLRRLYVLPVCRVLPTSLLAMSAVATIARATASAASAIPSGSSEW